MTIFDTIKLWADGQNALNGCVPERAMALQSVIDHVLPRLHRYASLADLATAYYTEDKWWPRLAEEFDLTVEQGQVVRGAVHWQRFMQLRHPSRAADRAS